MRFSLGAHTLNPLMEPWQAFIMEAILTFTLVFVIFANAVDSKGHGTIAPLAIGLSVAIDHLIGGLTGSYNARVPHSPSPQPLTPLSLSLAQACHSRVPR